MRTTKLEAAILRAESAEEAKRQDDVTITALKKRIEAADAQVAFLHDTRARDLAAFAIVLRIHAGLPRL